ncbi:MAG: hypothetical protein HUU50_05720 [Candidatus Brocadiae bacterium]|nr:hypothetical protein [Candidatus Brocadiia bacterium]
MYTDKKNAQQILQHVPTAIVEQTNVSVQMPKYRSCLFERQSEAVAMLYSPEDNNRKLKLSTAEWESDVDWFLVNCDNKIINLEKIYDILCKPSDQLAKTLRGMQQDYLTKHIRTKALVYWNIYSLDIECQQANLLARIKILHTPVIVEMTVKNLGKNHYEEFLPGKQNLQKNAHLRLKLITYKDTYLAIFLKNNKGQITRLYPPVGEQQTKLLEKDTVLFTPQSGIELLSAEQEYLCCFYSTKPVECLSLQKWLQRVNLTPYYQRGMADVAPPEPPAPIYLIGFTHKEN